MFEPIEGGSYEDINTLKKGEAFIRCYLPPVPKKEDILFSDLPTSEQYWRRTPLPEWWQELLLEETKAKENNPKYFNPKLQKFRNQEWLRRLNGVWFMNNGKPTYITGSCYYYLNWWRADHEQNGGYPIYNDEIRKRFYFRQICWEDPKCLGYLLIGSRGFGKELADYEPIKTFEGEIKIGEIKVGDKVYGKDGKLTNVVGVYPQGIKDIYRVHLGDGRHVDAGLEHLWEVYTNKKKKVVSTQEIMKSYKWDSGNGKHTYRYALPINDEVEYEHKELKIDPYVMGYMLGNGICNKSTPAVCTIDAQVLDYFKSALPEYEFNSDKTCDIKYSMKYVGEDKYSDKWGNKHGANPLYRYLCDYGVNVTCKEKFIPKDYLFSSIDQRYELLRGLMDSDGSINESGSIEFCSANERLINDVADLVRSLGIRCKKNVEKREGQLKLMPQGTHSVMGKMYRLFIRTDKPIFKIDRKLKRIKSRSNKPHTVPIVNIEYIGKYSATCISVDNEDKLFLTKDFIVTHNTTEESASIVENITKPPRRRQAVIQSKSEDDAKKVFLNKIRPSYNDLPEFFKPVSNHGTIPDKMLSFYRDLQRGKKAKLATFTEEDELQNTLWYAAAKEKQLSGQSISDLFNDEIGVTDPKKEADVYVRNQVNRFCVYRNHVKVGIIRATTTVEEMDKGGAQCKQVWDDSDITQRTANGFTKSGLYRYMVSDIDSSTQFCDKYGFINREKAREFHDNERLARQADHAELNSYIRKYPRDESEIFTKPANKCHFNAHELTQRLKAISEDIHKPYRQGNFEWENNIRHSKVVFEPCMHDTGSYEVDKDTYEKFCPKCRFFININTFPDASEQNNVEIQNIGGREFYVPKNQLKYTGGADPYQNSFVINEGKGSKAGFYIKRKYDYLIDPPEKPIYMHVTNAPSLEYLYRAGDVYEMYEDILKACWFHGCEVLPEANKIGLQKWLEEYYPYFLIKRPKGLTQSDPISAKIDNGLNSSTPVINAYTDAIEYDVKNNVHKYPFPRQLYQLLNFDNSNTQKFDAAVAWGFTLLGEQKKVEQVNVKIDDKFFRVYDRYGNEIR